MSASAGLVSDYRFRGVTLSANGPAIQGGVEVSRRGWLAGAWASTVETGTAPGTELDLYAGRAGNLGDLRYAVTGYAYLFPDQPVYFEGQVTLGRDMGPADVEIELAYAPQQPGAPRDNWYAGARVNVPVATAFALVARGGYEQSAFFGDKLDWELGANWSRGPFTLGASLIGICSGDRLKAHSGPTPIFSLTGTW